jgi:hypothetical protein
VTFLPGGKDGSDGTVHAISWIHMSQTHETDRDKLAVDENYFPYRNESSAANRKTFSQI